MNIYEQALAVHDKDGMMAMWKYLTNQVEIGNISEEESDCIGEEIMIYGC